MLELAESDAPWATLLKDRVLKNEIVIKHHIYSSLWSSIKEEYVVIQDNSIWLLGDGRDINFWNDPWFGDSISHLLNIPNTTRNLFTSTVNEYILNGQWHLPSQFIQSFPDIAQLIQNVPIPISSKKDQLMWKHSDTSDLLLKEAYIFKNQEFQDLH